MNRSSRRRPFLKGTSVSGGTRVSVAKESVVDGQVMVVVSKD